MYMKAQQFMGQKSSYEEPWCGNSGVLSVLLRHKKCPSNTRTCPRVIPAPPSVEKRDTSAIYETWTYVFQTPSVHQLFNTAFQRLLITPRQYFHCLNGLNKQDKAPKSFPQSLWLLYWSVLEMSMPACPGKGVSLVLEQAGGAQTQLQTETQPRAGEPGVMRPQDIEGETSEPKF